MVLVAKVAVIWTPSPSADDDVIIVAFVFIVCNSRARVALFLSFPRRRRKSSFKGQKKDIRTARKTDKGKCWREGTFVRVYICTTIRTIYEG